MDSDEGEDSNDYEDEDSANQPLKISISVLLNFIGWFAVRKLLTITRPTNGSILCLGLDSEDRCIRGLRTRSCKSTVSQTHIRNLLYEFPVETFLSGVQNLVTGLACQ